MADIDTDNAAMDIIEGRSWLLIQLKDLKIFHWIPTQSMYICNIILNVYLKAFKFNIIFDY